MTDYLVDPDDAREIDSDDLGRWLLFYLECHGANVTLDANQFVHVDLDPMGLDAETAHRWAPVAVRLAPEFRSILLARRAAGEPVA